TLELLVHLDDLELARLGRFGLRGGGGLRFRRGFRFVAEDLVALDLLVDAGGHAVRSCAGLKRLVQKKRRRPGWGRRPGCCGITFSCDGRLSWQPSSRLSGHRPSSPPSWRRLSSRPCARLS